MDNNNKMDMDNFPKLSKRKSKLKSFHIVLIKYLAKNIYNFCLFFQKKNLAKKINQNEI